MYAQRMQIIGTETAFEVMAKAKELEAKGKSIIHMEIGEPDFGTPKNICDAAVKALRDGYTHYSPAPGLPEHRQAIARHISKTRGVEIKSNEVAVAPGAKFFIFASVLACVNPGEEVIYPDPGYPIYESVIRFNGAVPVPLPLEEDKGFRFDIKELEKRISHLTKMIILNSPQNPTGGLFEKEDLLAIAELIKDKDIYVMSDEVYSNILYEGQHHSILSIPGMKEKAIVIDGYSKTFAMTGWRMGYVVADAGLIKHLSTLLINTTSNTCTFNQWAGIEALEGPQDEIAKMVEEFKTRRDFIVDGLNSISGISCTKPKGAFYAFPNITRTGMSSKMLADSLLYEAGVACLAGTCFGARGEGYLRFSYANSIDNIKEALKRIERFLHARKKEKILV